MPEYGGSTYLVYSVAHGSATAKVGVGGKVCGGDTWSRQG
jgi:hypothetical protein